MQWVSVLGAVESPASSTASAAEAASPTSEYDRFHEVMAEESEQSVVLAAPRHGLAAGARDRRAAQRPGQLGARRRLWLGARSLADGRGLPRESLHGSSTSARTPSRPLVTLRPSAGLDNMNGRAARRGEPRPRERVRPGHGLRRDPRPGPAAVGAGCDRASALKPGGNFLMQDIRGQSCVHDNMDHPVAPVPLHDLDDALHVGVARPGGRGPRHHVGRASRTRHARQGRLRERRLCTAFEHDEMNDFYVCAK